MANKMTIEQFKGKTSEERLLELFEGIFFPLCESARYQGDQKILHQAEGVRLTLETIINHGFLDGYEGIDDLLVDFRHEIKISEDYLSLRKEGRKS